MAKAETLFLSTTPGLEPALLREASALGEVRREEGGVVLSGADGLHRAANLRLSTASRVLWRIAQVQAGSLSQLEPALAKVPLSRWGRAFRVRARPERLEAVARRAFGLGDAGAEAPELLLRWVDGRCTVSLDTSGELLYLRGWRQEVGRAPLRETLAAGVLLLSGWDPSSPLWDPMCGSGTLAVEAALRACRKAPGLARAFAFERLACHDARAWEEEKARARAEERAPPSPILASDLNAGALGTARRNARRAGVLEHLRLSRLDATLLAPPPELAKGVLVSNLPYGRRVGSRDEVPALLAAFGKRLKEQFSGWRFALLAQGDGHELGLPFERTFRLDNGGLSTTLCCGAL